MRDVTLSNEDWDILLMVFDYALHSLEGKPEAQPAFDVFENIYNQLHNEDICEHGMSASLCMGPNHYPSRQDEMEGRYF